MYFLIVILSVSVLNSNVLDEGTLKISSIGGRFSASIPKQDGGIGLNSYCVGVLYLLVLCDRWDIPIANFPQVSLLIMIVCIPYNVVSTRENLPYLQPPFHSWSHFDFHIFLSRRIFLLLQQTHDSLELLLMLLIPIHLKPKNVFK